MILNLIIKILQRRTTKPIKRSIGDKFSERQILQQRNNQGPDSTFNENVIQSCILFINFSGTLWCYLYPLSYCILFLGEELVVLHSKFSWVKFHLNFTRKIHSRPYIEDTIFLRSNLFKLNHVLFNYNLTCK